MEKCIYTPPDKKILIHKLTRYLTELQTARYMLLDHQTKDDILKITKIDLDILEKQLENF